ncbi:hypothetical protein [Frigoriglobus tundricola]|uniref:Uncharacterized protein n=1 Tax=Frigoriglobus tundricola TaxID=2774151 RepID=A0A6M5YRN6_9BACT|nr:hypothetical protein [Frigoriglobus tundricola]QJW96090.1 hypothetical protein FTUN_3644 [Frigoriglobus tundricola]
MRKLLSLAVVLVVLAGSRAAPVPKDAPAIDGKYNLLSVSTPADREIPNGPGGLAPGGFGGGGPGGGWGVAAPAGWPTISSVMVGPATITKNEITFEGSGSRGGPLGATRPMTTMEYTLDTTKTPMTIDVENISVRGKKTRSLGLVEVKGDRLVIALAKAGDERPKTTEEANDVTVYYLKKAPPPPRTEYRIVAMTVGKEEEAEKELNKLAAAGYELVNTTNPAAANDKAAPTTVHFVLKRTVKQP